MAENKLASVVLGFGLALSFAVTGTALASQGQQLTQVALVMLLFGLGAALPIIVLGMLSRQGMQKFRDKLLFLGGKGQRLLGMLILALGVMMLTGTDKLVEARLLDVAPEWLVRLTTMI